ncbi:MAG: 4Fe-4S dicluster domain-containing protein [Chloroflexi bacterium]|nr:4Fe-4S dicluster domain-containing protein [Chloroflexota bacterium]
MSLMTIEQRLALNTYEVDTEPHIRLKEEICRQCERQSCLYVCPAECFKAREGKISFNHEGCLECGSCHISCSREAIEWSYPRGHFGVSYEYG